MIKTETKERVKTAINEATALSEQWLGTLHEQTIQLRLNSLLSSLSDKKEGRILKLLKELENATDLARREADRSTNEG